MAKKKKNPKSTRHQYPLEGAYGIVLRGPLSLCGDEDRGGVFVTFMGNDGQEHGGGTMMREHVMDMHYRLGQWVKLWQSEEAK